MKKKINICIIGAGNISNTRHIPALKKNKNCSIYGLISNSQKNIIRTQSKYKIDNSILLKNNKGDFDLLKESDWFKRTDAVVIGTPPKTHYKIAKMCLSLNKHVLIEKPMTLNPKESKELIDIAKKNKVILNVVHNFQFADGMLKLTDIIKKKKYGEIVSIMEVQFTNRKRRLPVWYDNLPLGLFYDEAAHFFYLLEKHCGKVDINNADAIYSEKGNTPTILSINANSKNIPIKILLNFNTPICEWIYMVSFKDHIAYYDFFKDILIILPTDKEHQAKDIAKNSFLFTLQYWLQFINKGFSNIAGNLFYGHNVVVNKFINSIINGTKNKEISGEKGMSNVILMNEVIAKAKKINVQ